MVSKSRISPTRMTSGSSRSDCRKARAKEREWLSIARGSGHENQALRIRRQIPEVLGQPDVGEVRYLERHQPEDARESLALKKDVRSEAAESRILVAEVDLQALLEQGAALGRQNRVDPLFELRRGRLRHRQRGKLSVQPDVRDGARREVEVRGADGARVPEKLGERRFGCRVEVVGNERPAGIGPVVRDLVSRELLGQASRLLPHERVRVRLDDLREKSGHGSVGDPDEGVENLETEVLRAALVGVE